MIELTQQQVAALANPGETPPRVMNPETKENFVLISVDEHNRLTDDGYDYDDSELDQGRIGCPPLGDAEGRRLQSVRQFPG